MQKRIRLQLLLISLSVTLTLASGRAFATKIAYEGFDYAPGSLNGLNGGTGFGAPWAADPGVMVVPPGLSSPYGLPSTGLEIGGGFNASRNLSAGLAGPEFWVSFELEEMTPNDQVWLGLNHGPGNMPQVFFGRRLDHYFLDAGGSFVTCCVGSPLGFTDFMAARFQHVGATYVVDVWLNTDNFALPPNLSAVMPYNVWNFVDMQVQPGLFADEVRIGTTAGDVANVPEPASLTMLATGILGGLGILRRRLL